MARWSGAKRREAERAAGLLIAGRGEGDSIWTDGTVVIHLRRRLTEAERLELPPGWMAVPAVDRG